MSQAIVDPEEMIQFAQHLQIFSGDLHERLTGLKAKFDHLSHTWKDHDRERFSQIFDQTIHVLVQFMAEANVQVPFLIKKAEKIKEYQEHQM